MIGKKPYTEWNINEVQKNILRAKIETLYTFNLDKLPQDHNPITEAEFNSFVEEIKKTLSAFQNEININEMTVREYISVFMKTTVYHLQKMGYTANLCVERDINGSKAYGPIDYLVEINGSIVLINEAKLQDLLKGLAQLIMQLYSASEVTLSFFVFIIFKVELTFNA